MPFLVVIVMGILNLLEMRNYWQKGLFNIPWPREVFTTTGFKSIERFFHLNNNTQMTVKADFTYKLYKLDDFPKALNDSFKSDFYSSREISVDKQMIGAKSTTSLIQS